ncbi:unnamed protein product [Linum tenue]|uniref:Uncharacterized protein n=1 Tax=Linum tenue TaxID=586396 RepID=A0AAV0IM12_9ROSI|nr:unnamed protein product [Linum tenue]
MNWESDELIGNFELMRWFVVWQILCAIGSYLQRKHLVDVTEIYNQLSREKTKKPEAFQAGYLVILLVLSLFWLLWTIAGEEFD